MKRLGKIYPNWIRKSRNPERQKTPVYEKFIGPDVPHWELMSKDELDQSALDLFHEYTSDQSAFEFFEKRTRKEKINDLWENARLGMMDIPSTKIKPTTEDLLEVLWDYTDLLDKVGGVKNARLCFAICHLMNFLEGYKLENQS